MTDSTLDALIDRHAAVLGWLARLERARPHAPDPVFARVREDYRARLHAVEAELAPRLDALRSEREALRPGLHDAEQLYALAADELDEARLRYLAGEVAEAEWLERSPALEAAARALFEEREQIASRLGALHALVTRLDGSAAADEDAPTAAVWDAGPASGATDSDEGGLPLLELLDAAERDGAAERFDEMDFLHWVAGDAEPPAEAPERERARDPDADDEADFLAELDRALGR